jgi:hypothetical protein
VLAAPRVDAPSKLNSVFGRDSHLPPFPTPCEAVLGEPASGPTEYPVIEILERPGPVRGPGSWRPSCEGRRKRSLERR